MFKISFELNLFSKMFRGCLQIIFVTENCFFEKKRHHKFSSVHFTQCGCHFWYDRPLQIKFCMSMRKGLIFPFFMSRLCDIWVLRSQSIFKFYFWRFWYEFVVQRPWIYHQKAEIIIFKTVYFVFLYSFHIKGDSPRSKGRSCSPLSNEPKIRQFPLISKIDWPLTSLEKMLLCRISLTWSKNLH